MKAKQTISKDIVQSPEEIYTLFLAFERVQKIADSIFFNTTYSLYALLICHSQTKHTEPRQTPKKDKDS